MAFLFKHSKQQKPAEKGAEWPPLPIVQAIPLSALQTVQALPGIEQKLNYTGKYPRTLVIGLGEAGGQIIGQWLEQVEQEQIGKQEYLRVCFLRDSNQLELQSSQAQIQTIDLVDVNGDLPTAFGFDSHDNQRKEKQDRFRLSKNISNFSSWLSQCLTQLSGDIKVLIVGSLSDPLVGIVGDLLQILRLEEKYYTSYKSISLLLTTQSANPRFPLGLEYQSAALREITRMRLGGKHVLPSLPGYSGKVYESALVDLVFLLGDDTGGYGSVVPKFEQSCGEAAAELLYILVHPSSDSIWENFQNLHQADNDGVVTIGISTLYTPIEEIKDYIAARLLEAALFGEREDRKNEGLISFENNPYDLFNASVIGNRWLIDGPSVHEFFNWLALFLKHPETLSSLHKLANTEQDYIHAFRTQIAHGLTHFLNDKAETDHLRKAIEILEWFEVSLGALIKRISLLSQKIDPALVNKYVTIFNKSSDTISQLKNSLENWLKAIDAEKGSASLSPSAITFKPFNANKPEFPGAMPDGPHSLKSLIKQQKEESQKAVETTAHGRFRSALFQGASSELDIYYRSTIRPELSNGGDNGNAFKRVNERLAWWVKVELFQEPEVYLCFVPARLTGKEVPPHGLYLPKNLDQLAEAITEIARLQAARCEDDFSGKWMTDKMTGGVSSTLGEARQPLLAFGNVDVHETLYIIARNNEVTKNIRDLVSKGAISIKEITGGETNRCTVMSLWPNIPIASIEIEGNKLGSFRQREKYYLYAQEKNAAQYEELIWKYFSDKAMSLPPTLTMLLADLKLVTLFCQALFGGLIHLQTRTPGIAEWTLESLDRFRSLDLKIGDLQKPETLFNAFREFTLELPYQSGNKFDENPTSPFAYQNQSDFLNLLHEHALQRRRALEFPQCPPELIHQINAWRQNQNDTIIRGFLAILAVELKQPVWDGWEK